MLLCVGAEEQFRQSVQTCRFEVSGWGFREIAACGSHGSVTRTRVTRHREKETSGREIGNVFLYCW